MQEKISEKQERRERRAQAVAQAKQPSAPPASSHSALIASQPVPTLVPENLHHSRRSEKGMVRVADRPMPPINSQVAISAIRDVNMLLQDIRNSCTAVNL